MEFCKYEKILIRDLEKDDKDFEYLYNWLNNRNVSKFYGSQEEKVMDFIKQKYGNKIADSQIFPCIFEYDGVPIGYIQFYDVNAENYDLSQEMLDKIVSKQDRVIAIDVFIGEDEYRDKGIGTKVIKLLLNTLFKKYDVDVVLIDPKTNNERAISCYRKCGFQECFVAKQREEQDGIKYDNLIMKIENKLFITTKVDREAYEKNITDDKIINLTGESGSGKSYFSKVYNNDDYIIIDTDLIFKDNPTENKHLSKIRSILKEKYDKSQIDICENFDIIYKEILDCFKDSSKTLVIDSAQYRNLKDLALLKGKIIIMRTGVDKCYERCIERWKENHIKTYGNFSRRRIREI